MKANPAKTPNRTDQPVPRHTSFRITGLYAVTPDEPETAILVARTRAALDGGARLIQYRNKSASASLRREQAAALLCLCRGHEVPLIINDHLDLALEIDAEGVHLGGDDGPVSEARARLGPAGLLGVSCYNSLPAAVIAVHSGADYVAFGSFFASTVKPGAVHAPLGLLSDAKRALGVPIVAIGGITSVNAPQLIHSGADAVAVISAVFDAPDVRRAARDFDNLFPKRP